MSELRRVIDFQRQHKSIVLFMFVVATTLISTLFWGSLFTPSALPVAAFFTMAGSHGAMRRLSALHERMCTENSEVTWTVRVNGAVVGEIPDSQYAAFQYFEVLDFQNYLRQLVNFLHGTFNAAVEFLIIFPALVLWAGVCAYFAAPTDFVSILSEVQKITPSQAAALIPSFLLMLFLFAGFMAGFSAMVGYSFGVRNKFKQAIIRQVRLHLNCAADGEVQLDRNDANVAYARPAPVAAA